nr:unnamed protein product [Digitaria exilis]
MAVPLLQPRPSSTGPVLLRVALHERPSYTSRGTVGLQERRLRIWRFGMDPWTTSSPARPVVGGEELEAAATTDGQRAGGAGGGMHALVSGGGCGASLDGLPGYMTPGAGLLQAVRPAVLGGQTACPHGRPKMLIPKRPEVGTWKMNVAKEPPVTSGQTARQGQLPRVPPKQVYRPKKKEEVQSMDVDSERTTEFDIIRVGTMDKRKLQRLRFREKQEQELEKQRDEVFNQVKPMIPQKKEWKPKEDRQAVQPAVQAVQTACQETTSQAVRPPVQAVRPGGAEALGISSSGSSIGDGKPTSVPTAEDDEELVDYSSSPERMNLDVNVLHMSMDGDMLSEEEGLSHHSANEHDYPGDTKKSNEQQNRGHGCKIRDLGASTN